MVQKLWATLWIIILTTATVLAAPFFVQKRQSDQRIAELETLLAMRKYGVGYGAHRFGGKKSPVSGLIDYNYIGRRKKSTGTGKSFEDGEEQRGTLASSSSSFWPSSNFSGHFYRMLNMESGETTKPRKAQ